MLKAELKRLCRLNNRRTFRRFWLEKNDDTDHFSCLKTEDFSTSDVIIQSCPWKGNLDSWSDLSCCSIRSALTAAALICFSVMSICFILWLSTCASTLSWFPLMTSELNPSVSLPPNTSPISWANLSKDTLSEPSGEYLQTGQLPYLNLEFFLIKCDSEYGGSNNKLWHINPDLDYS